MDPFALFFKRLLGVLTGVGALLALTPFWSSWKPSDKVSRDSGPIKVDLSHLEPGKQMTVMWRGKPIWVLRRTQDMIAELSDEHQLRDPKSLYSHQPMVAQNKLRSINPEYAVLVGLCTHLGCVPKLIDSATLNHRHGAASFYCPCHGSRFDLAGRVYTKSPATTNLEVPPYHFIAADILVLGEEA